MGNDVQELIGMLYNMITDAWGLPLGAEKCVIERDKVLDMLDEIRTRYDLSIFLSTHDFSTLEHYADQVILLQRQVLKAGSPRQGKSTATQADAPSSARSASRAGTPSVRNAAECPSRQSMASIHPCK